MTRCVTLATALVVDGDPAASTSASAAKKEEEPLSVSLSLSPSSRRSNQRALDLIAARLWGLETRETTASRRAASPAAPPSTPQCPLQLVRTSSESPARRTAAPLEASGRSASEASGRRSPSPPEAAVRELALLNRWRQVARIIASSAKRPRGSESEASTPSPSPSPPPVAELAPHFSLSSPAPGEFVIRAADGAATRITVRDYEPAFVQLSGHEGGFVAAGPGTVWKRQSSAAGDWELRAYRRLMRDEMSRMVPEFYGSVRHDGCEFLEMEDLLFRFARRSLCVCDLKMGTRTFLESEVANATARRDLYEKMLRIDPDGAALTAAERAAGAVTKLRYMQFREAASSSSTLGFRIEGFSVDGGPPLRDLQLVRERGDVSRTLERFLASATPLQRQTFVSRLRVLRAKFSASAFFRRHEVIGASLLLIRDATGRAGVWMIDFARTLPLPDGLQVTHRAAWQLGNHEDGFLTGLDNLIDMMEQLARDGDGTEAPQV